VAVTRRRKRPFRRRRRSCLRESLTFTTVRPVLDAANRLLASETWMRRATVTFLRVRKAIRPTTDGVALNG